LLHRKPALRARVLRRLAGEAEAVQREAEVECLLRVEAVQVAGDLPRFHIDHAGWGGRLVAHGDLDARRAIGLRPIVSPAQALALLAFRIEPTGTTRGRTTPRPWPMIRVRTIGLRRASHVDPVPALLPHPQRP